MKIKSKLTVGLGFLFLVIVLIASVAIIYINRIAKESREILKDNYESVQIAKTMLKDLDGLGNDTTSFYSKLETRLNLQEKNITEVGELEYTRGLRSEFDKMKQNGITTVGIKKMKDALYVIVDLNMDAIQKKNSRAQANADNVLTYIGVIGALCFIVVFTFIINFPGYIANPIKQLTKSIKQISEKNYDQRLEFKSKDEFGELAEAFNAMAKRLEQYESSSLADIMFEKQRIETIINNMKDAIIGLNEKKVLIFANIRAVQLIGLQEQEMLGKYAPKLAVNNELMRMLISTEPLVKPIRIITDAKESFFTKENINVTSNDRSIGEVILLKNITEYQELDLAKTNFIATISHELKTPIASIKLSSKLLEDDRVGNLNTEQQQLIHHIQEDSDRLLKITSELLNMTQVETGKIQLNFQKIQPKNMIDYAVEAIKFQADQKGIKIEIECSEELPMVNADFEKTVWILVNLLNNSLRYSPENKSIIVKVNPKGDKVVFSVRDFGIGIEPKYQKKIFDKYFRVPSSKKEGTGLGLAISREFIEAQNGAIYLESTPGIGTTFFFELEKSRND